MQSLLCPFYGALKTHSKARSSALGHPLMPDYALHHHQRGPVHNAQGVSIGRPHLHPAKHNTAPTFPVTHQSYLLPRLASLHTSIRPTLQKRSDLLLSLSASGPALPLRPPRRQLTRPPLFSFSFRNGRKTRGIAILFPIRECFTISQLSRLLPHYQSLQILSRYLWQVRRIAFGAFDRHPIGGEGSSARSPTVACDHLGARTRIQR